MTDREILELAAKAAGIQLEWRYNWRGNELDEPWHDGSVWEPQNDDGQALRLAARLGIAIQFYRNAPPELGLPRECAVSVTPDRRWFSESGPDENAATRRAIVRAAAEIGKSL